MMTDKAQDMVWRLSVAEWGGSMSADCKKRV